jgi:predicted RNA binding protein YcfA (HicA-like mRNA interferase family)
LLALTAKSAIIMFMNSGQKETLRAILGKPTPNSLNFKAIENLLKALGCKVIEGDGSRVRFVKDQAVLTLHRPHPGKEAKPYQVRDVRNYLVMLGVSQEDSI